MSINHHFSSSDLPEALWWAQQQRNMEPSKKSSSSKHNTYNNNIPDQATTTTNAYNFWTNSHLIYPHNYPMCTQNSAFGFDLNNEDEEQLITITDHQDINNNNKDQERRLPEVVVGGEEEEEEIKKQPLFEKPLTPSDVGKLNRLVIPKQHAEKYLPLNGRSSSAADSGGEKGVLLSFEDELGKAWRFRYSYWNSSQSYVLTKGWSRFVKEKKLDAGDIVLFLSHPLDSHRLFIGWRKRNNILPAPPHHLTPPAAAAAGNTTTFAAAAGGTTTSSASGWTRLFFPAGHPYPPPTHTSHGDAPPLSLPYQPDSCLHAARVLQSQTMSTPASGSATSKRLRLFGVNLDLELYQQQPEVHVEEEEEEEEEEDYSDQPPTPEEGSSGSSQQTHHHNQTQYQYNYQQHYFTNHKLHPTHMDMDMNFSRDVNQTRYHQG